MKTTTATVETKKLTKREIQRELDKQLGLKRSDEAFTLPASGILMLEEDRDDNPRNAKRYGALAEGNNKMTYEELKASIKERGQIQAIFVYYNEKKGAYCLAVGWRRLTAINELIAEGEEITAVKCVMASNNREERAFLHFEENMQDALEDSEKAVGIHRLHTVYKVPLMVISKRLGMEYQKVAKLASMMDNASSAVVEAMRGGEVSVSTVQALNKAAADTVEQNDLFEQGRQAAIQEAKEKEAERKTKRAAALAEKLAKQAAATPAPLVADEHGELIVTAEPVKVKGTPGRKAAPKLDDIQDVDAGRVYTADDITTEELGTVRVKAAHIPKLISKVGLETKMVVALRRANDLGSKVDQALVARIANIVLYMNDPDYVMTADNLVNMFSELSDNETTEMFDSVS